MRCPVPAHIGLSTAVIASAPMECPRCFTKTIFPPLSSSGHPASVTPKALFLNSPVFRLQASRARILFLVVALDAVLRLIQRGVQIHPRIGQLESLAMPPFVLRQRQPCDSAINETLDGNQMRHVQLMWDLKQDSSSMLLSARRRERSPRSVLSGRGQLRHMIRFILQPSRYVIHRFR